MAHPRPRGLLVVLSLALAIGIGALILSFQNALALGAQAEQRNRDRITSDLASCERGNDRGRQIKDGFAAVNESINQIIDIANPKPPLRAQLDAPLLKLRTAASAIKIVDCDKAVPGARETP